MGLVKGMVKRRFLNLRMGRSLGMVLDGFIVRQEGMSMSCLLDLGLVLLGKEQGGWYYWAFMLGQNLVFIKMMCCMDKLRLKGLVEMGDSMDIMIVLLIFVQIFVSILRVVTIIGVFIYARRPC